MNVHLVAADVRRLTSSAAHPQTGRVDLKRKRAGRFP
jgi:hypothetical protein